jgi:hypothetical protein
LYCPEFGFRDRLETCCNKDDGTFGSHSSRLGGVHNLYTIILVIRETRSVVGYVDLHCLSIIGISAIVSLANSCTVVTSLLRAAYLGTVLIIASIPSSSSCASGKIIPQHTDFVVERGTVRLILNSAMTMLSKAE